MKAALPVWSMPWLAPLLLSGCMAEPAPEGYRSPGKPRPPILLRLTETPRLQAGVPVTLKLELTLPEGAESHSIEFDQDSALRVTGVAQRAGGRLEAAVMPMTDGPQAVAGFITFRLGGTVQGAPFHLRLPAGRGPASAMAREPTPAGVLKEDATAGTVMSLTAETTYR